MNNKGFISISVVYALFMLFLMLLLSILAGYVTNRILLKTAKGDTTEILINSEDNRQISVVCLNQRIGSCFALHNNLDKDLYFHDQDDIDTKSELEAGDNNYRYSGANPFNYLCFGSDIEPCPENNLYRILGIYNNQIKLIKYKPIAHNWNNVAANYWRDSSLFTYLNDTFLKTFSNVWQQKIAKTSWNIGGLSYNDSLSNNALTTFTKELTNKITVDAKIGLMYVSDYYYAADPKDWNKKGLDSTGNDYRRATNWLKGYNEFLLSNNTDKADQAFTILTSGNTGCDYVTSSLNVRPAFYLYQQVSLVDGIGTISDPYRVN